MLVNAETATNAGLTDSARKLYEKIIQKSEADNFMHGKVDAIAGIGFMYLHVADYSQALTYFNKALSFCAKSDNKKDSSICYNDIGLLYFYKGDYNRASEYYYLALKGLRTQDILESKTGVNIYTNLALVNLRLGQKEKALYYVHKGESISRNKQFDYHLVMSLNNKAVIYRQTAVKLDSILSIYSEVIDISKRKGFEEIEASAEGNSGEIYTSVGQYKKALPYLEHATAMAKNKYAPLYLSSVTNLAVALCHLGRCKEAEDMILPILFKARIENHKDNVISVYQNLADIYKTEGKYNDALDCMDSIFVLKDSLFNIGIATAMNEQDLKYKTSEKDKEIAQNQLLIAQQKSKIARKNIWMVSIGSFILLLLLTSIGGFIHKQRLQAERIKSLEQANKIGILKAAVEGEDNERSRIARELHDGIGGMLSAAMMRLSTMHHKNEAIMQLPAYSEAMEILTEMGDEIRKTSHNLMPEVLLKQNLPEAVRTYCNHVQESGALQIDFQSFGSFDNLTENFKLNVYRIIQELLKNITQHARAGHAFVQLLVDENVMTITVEDDGIGFDPNEIKNGIGLHNLHTRVSSLDGHITIESEKGKGSSVIIGFDIPEPRGYAGKTGNQGTQV